jgi:YesN/AraC family two-component response regulator
MEKCQTGRFDINSAAIQHLIDALKLGRADAVGEHLDSIISSLYNCEYNVLMSTLSYLTSSVFNVLTLIEKNSMLTFDVDFVCFSSRISSLETLEEIRQEYLNLFQRAINRLSQRKDQNSCSNIANVAKFIESNYRDRSLCADSLAARFNLTTAYLGKLFRESMSKSISDYISDIRIAKAKELLANNSHTVDEILDRIGWENKKYFFTVFKKNTGTTPTEFKLKSKVFR